jgi:uncharacterized protein with beta-barrel porin domain
VSNCSIWRLAWSRGARVPSSPTFACAAALAVLWVATGAQAQQCTTSGANQTCTNSISLSGGANGIFDSATLTVTNTSSGTISGGVFGVNAADTANVTNFGIISGGVFGINATNAANIINYGTISGGISISASVSNVTNNLGTISGSVFGVSANVATVNNSGSISGGTSGIFATTATVTNSGTILAAAGGRGINATNAATVTNSGTISGGALGVFANNIADVSNSGTLSGSSFGIGAGSGTVTNSGTISGVTGINFGDNSDVLNSGTVTGTGGTAINFGAGSNMLTLGPGFVINGKVIGAGTDTFRLGGAGSGTFDLNLIGATRQYEGFSTFNKVGSSTWTLIGTNALALPWTVQRGTLDVTGSLTNSPFTVQGGTLLVGGTIGTATVDGGLLAGNGTVGTTEINNGGTFAPGALGTSMTVSGNLAFQSGAVYLVQVRSTASFANVTGTATLSGNVVVAFAPGNSVLKQYDILHAEALSSTFAGANSANALGFALSLSYTNTDVFLNLNAGLGVSGGLNVNQQNVANAINDFFNNGGSLPASFSTLFGLSGGNLANALTQLSGEAATDSQQVTVNAMNLFLGVLTDPFVVGRGAIAPPGSATTQFTEENEYSASAYDANGRKRTGSERDAYSMITKAQSYPMSFDQRWSVWAAGFGGSQTTDGNATLGSNSTTSRLGGVAVGADYRFSPNTIAGFALAGGGTNFNLANAFGSGRSDLFQAGAFVRHSSGQAYISGALAYGWQDITTDRTVTVAGVDQLRAQFNANAWSGRVEGGYRFVSAWLGGIAISPYVAGQFTTFDLPAYAEQAVVGANTFALAYGAKSVTASRSELGLRGDKSFAMQDGIFTLRGRAAWAHDFNTDRNIGATFQMLPGASFVVNGAAEAPDAALITASAEKKWLNGWSATATFEGEFSSITTSYAGKGVVRYAW